MSISKLVANNEGQTIPDTGKQRNSIVPSQKKCMKLTKKWMYLMIKILEAIQQFFNFF